MPKFLNHLDLNGNQLKNTKLEITDSPLAEEGVIHYHDTNNTIRYHNGTGFITLGDNDTATSTAAGVVELFSDTAQTVAANSVSATTGKTYGVQLNSSGQMVVNVPWTDANDNTQNAYSVSIPASSTKLRLTGAGAAGATTDDIEFTGAGATTVTRTSADEFTISSTDTQNDASAIRTLVGSGNDGVIPSTGTAGHFLRHDGSFGLPSYTTNTNLDNAGVIGKVLTGMVTTTGGAVAASDSILVGFGKLEKRVALNDAKVTNSQVSTDVTLVTTSHDYLTLSGQAITLAAIDATTDISGALPIDHGGTGQTTAAAAASALLNTSQGGALTVGDASDTITIAGNLTVSGTTTTIDSTTVATGDNMLELAKDNTANATDFGWYGKFIDSGTKYAGMNWDASATKFKLGYGDDAPTGTIDWDNAGHLEVGKLTTTDLVVGGHTISDVDVTSEASGADDHLMTAAAITALIADNANSFSTATGVANNADVTPSWVPANDPSYLTSAPNTMGSGFTVSATTDTNPTTITQGDDLFFAAGTGITCATTADGTVTITNTVTDTNTMGSGFTVAATTTGTGTTITEGDSLTLAAGTGITTTGTSDGIVTITNSSPNVVQTTITGNAGSATVLADGAVGGVKVFELTHTGTGAGQVANENSSNSTDSAVWTITHGMGSSRFYKVEVVLDSGDYDTVYVDVQRPLDTTIKLTFGADVANGAYRAMVTRMA